MKSKPLDYLLIPTGWTHQRKKRAINELESDRKIKHILILNGNNSEEDMLYLGKILKGGERIGFVTFPLHYDEYKLIIKKAQKQKEFPKNIKIENITTNETFKEFIYGILGLLDEEMHKEVTYTNEQKKNFLISGIKQFIRRILK